MNRRSRKIIVAFAVSIFVLISYLYLNREHLPFSEFADSTAELVQTGRGEPKITVIVPWQSRNGAPPPPYIPYFFQSVEANPKVDLLFIHIVDHQDDCSPFWNAPNVKEICLSNQDFYELHADYLCERWKCTQEEKTYLLDFIIKQGARDGNRTFFRLFRNGVFKRWLDPATTLWGWCDVDTFWGNFDRTFPWDIAHDFDVIAIAGQPDFAEERLIFTRGHMTFLANTPELADKLFSYKKFRSLRSFLSATPFLLDAEESEFSHFLIAENTNITFLQLEGMVNSYDAGLFSQAGTFYASLQSDQITPGVRKRLVPLIRPKNNQRIPTFSAEGVESLSKLLPGKDYGGGLWFDSQYAQFVRLNWTQHEREQKAYFMRREAGGPFLQRWEPRDRFLSKDGELTVDECLYKHFQEEKRKPWFKHLPSTGLKAGEMMYQIGDKEVQFWDESGQIVFRTSSDNVDQSL